MGGDDLNGDGDVEDGVLHVHDLEADETRNLRLSGGAVAIEGNWLALSASEVGQNADLDRDGDVEGASSTCTGSTLERL